ncbi:KH domain-containing protein [Desulfitobacterium sp.]|uniref:KH domain-containing protein n=1 Tax=Desulfitobacterium sp. TaxID=49981 RepID=UPI002B1FA3FE|nr:KH domain-containing protein [Desulfitobacterium sp.]MEA4900177.1 KH domain-containing protein [Desulfitobacterium sp.]
MKELVEVLAKALVDYPDQVIVAQTESEKTVHLQLTVAPEDMGKVIGKQGKIANAIRTIVKAAAVKDGRRVHVDIDQ